MPFMKTPPVAELADAFATETTFDAKRKVVKNGDIESPFQEQVDALCSIRSPVTRAKYFAALVKGVRLKEARGAADAADARAFLEEVARQHGMSAAEFEEAAAGGFTGLLPQVGGDPEALADIQAALEVAES